MGGDGGEDNGDGDGDGGHYDSVDGYLGMIMLKQFTARRDFGTTAFKR